MKQEPTWDDWLNSPECLAKPKSIRDLMAALPANQLYALESGKQCYIHSYDENEDGTVTLTVQKTGVGGPFGGLGALDSNQVFGLATTDLTPWNHQ